MIRSIIGHTGAVAALNRSLAEGRPAHAYLFAGPTGIGKRTLALALARAVNCGGAEPPCDACSICRRIDAGKHPDVEIVAPGGICDDGEHDHRTDAGRDIRICQVRRAERVLGIAPLEGSRRVLILDPADAMNAQSADAFLKTLEEPPANALIVLVTAAEDALSETVRSRCRRVPLQTLPPTEAERALVERFEASPEQAVRLIRIFGGRIGHAVEALRDPRFEEQRAALVDGAARIAGATLDERFDAARLLADAYARREPARADENGVTGPPARAKDGKPTTRSDVYATLDAWIEWWRDLLLTAGGAGSVAVNAEHAAALAQAAHALGVEAAVAGIRALRETRRDLEQNVNARLALEALMLRLPRFGGQDERRREGPAAAAGSPRSPARLTAR